jgi:hypothetical protein
MGARGEGWQAFGICGPEVQRCWGAEPTQKLVLEGCGQRPGRRSPSIEDAFLIL